MNKLFDVAIVGAGPAGLTCAIYARRGTLSVAIFERATPGGKVVKTNEVENYPGFTKVEGPILALEMFQQTRHFEPEFFFEEIIKIIQQSDKTFILETSTGNKFQARTIFYAAGTQERLLGVPGETEYYGRGVSYCAICDGALYRDKTMIVIGGGNTALDEALYLTLFTKKLYLVHRRQEFRADKTTVKRIQKTSEIQLILDTIATEFVGDGKRITAIKLKNLKTNKEQIISTPIIYPFIGSDPVTQPLANFPILDTMGYITVDFDMQTKIPGLFAGGDAIQKKIRQITTAINDGTIAAQAIIHYLDHING